MWNTVLQRFVLPLACFSFGFGSSQMLAVQALRDRVKDNTSAMISNERDLKREQDSRLSEENEIRRQIAGAREETEKRMSYVVTLMEGLMKQNSEVIGLFKLQQQIH